jgi:hypothetical protein
MRVVYLLIPLLVGCATFQEEHYFVTKDTSGTPINFFRVRVHGNTGLSRMRYVSGFYDERAVDLYFNEVKNNTDNTPRVDIAPLFTSGQKNPGTDETLTPLTPAPGHGALLMIFSSNPNSVANTIGQFAETQQTADAITNLVNHKQVEALRAQTRSQGPTTLRFTNAATELTTIISTLPDPTNIATTATASNKTQAQATSLNALRSIAITLGGDGNFATFADARTWFSAQRAARSTP